MPSLRLRGVIVAIKKPQWYDQLFGCTEYSKNGEKQYINGSKSVVGKTFQINRKLRNIKELH